VIDRREVLEQNLQELTAQYQGREIPRPPHWGGYRLVPGVIEFWQGRSNRLHDRLVYTRSEGEWAMVRLAP